MGDVVGVLLAGYRTYRSDVDFGGCLPMLQLEDFLDHLYLHVVAVCDPCAVGRICVAHNGLDQFGVHSNTLQYICRVGRRSCETCLLDSLDLRSKETQNGQEHARIYCCPRCFDFCCT